MARENSPKIVIDYRDRKIAKVYIVSPRQLFETEPKKTLVGKIYHEQRLLLFFKGERIISRRLRKNETPLEAIVRRIPTIKKMQIWKTRIGWEQMNDPNELVLTFN